MRKLLLFFAFRNNLGHNIIISAGPGLAGQIKGNISFSAKIDKAVSLRAAAGDCCSKPVCPVVGVLR